jgi:glycosyltransferase involved in cell wall biosynthesis
VRTQAIFHIITTIERGGAENAVLTLAIAQARTGLNVTVVPLKGKPELKDILELNGVRVDLKALNKNPITHINLLKSFVRDDSIFHAHLPRAELFCRLALGQGCYVITRHNSEAFFPNAPRFFSRTLSQWVTKETKVIAISEAVHRFLKENDELHSSSLCKVIYYGYEPKFEAKIRRAANRLFDHQVIHLGTISRLTAQKNLALLIHLTYELSSKGYNLETSIVGSGPLEKDLKILSASLGIQDKIHFLGRRSDVFEFLSSIDIFLLTSKYEGFGLALLEAMDAGKPIIASGISSIPEVLGKTHPGLFESGSLESLLEKTLLFLRSPQVRTNALNAQEKRLNYFSVFKYFKSHEGFYS